jgi:hypothetical protein
VTFSRLPVKWISGLFYTVLKKNLSQINVHACAKVLCETAGSFFIWTALQRGGRQAALEALDLAGKGLNAFSGLFTGPGEDDDVLK